MLAVRRSGQQTRVSEQVMKSLCATCLPRCSPAVSASICHYAQDYYLGADRGSLAARIRDWPVAEARQLPLVHPSPRNRRWLKAHAWFAAETVPEVRRRVAECPSSAH